MLMVHDLWTNSIHQPLIFAAIEHEGKSKVREPKPVKRRLPT